MPRSWWRRATVRQRLGLILAAAAAAVLVHALTVSHTTYDDRFMLYFRSRQLWRQRYYRKHDYFLGALYTWTSMLGDESGLTIRHKLLKRDHCSSTCMVVVCRGACAPLTRRYAGTPAKTIHTVHPSMMPTSMMT